MRKLLVAIFLITSFSSFSQNGWTVCTAPASTNRIDDIFMVNPQTGYGVSGDGMIMKTTDGGSNWSLLTQESNIYFRSVEFLDEQTGFIGGFPRTGFTPSILRKTIDGGATWIDLTPQLSLRAREGICGLAIADANTIYGCGNWYKDSAYIIKSTDGGSTWSEINMAHLATSLIDLYFLNKDTGFATGKSTIAMQEVGVIFYTTNGGLTWQRVYSGDHAQQYCWKIQRLDPLTYFVSVQDKLPTSPKILRSTNGGLSWTKLFLSGTPFNIQGVGFIDQLHGWAGGDSFSYETIDGGQTWTPIQVCPAMNRVLRLNDSTMLASGFKIWKYNKGGLITSVPDIPAPGRFVSLTCHPNPVNDILKIDVAITVHTHVSLLLLDASGRRIKVIDNTNRVKGSYKFNVNTAGLPAGTYYVSLMTHEDIATQKIIVSR